MLYQWHVVAVAAQETWYYVPILSSDETLKGLYSQSS